MKNRTFSHNIVSKADRISRRRRRGTARLFVLSAAFMASTSVAALAKQTQFSGPPEGGPHVNGGPFGQAPAGATAAQAGRVQYAIPAGPLGDLLERFEQTSGVTLTLAMPELAALQSPGVTGSYTVQEALDQLLMGTSLSARLTASNTALLDIQTRSESVEVRASAPGIQSPKYQVPLRDIAQTIAIIPRAVMEEQGATTLSEALRNVPGITLQAGEGGGSSNTAGDMFTMRGFNASNSLFVDGVRDDGLISRDVFNLEQVEVFLGPTGSDIGRGTAAGYVNMTTKMPRAGASYSAAYSAGTAEQSRLSADMNWGRPMDHQGSWVSNSAFRLNVLWQDSGVPGRDEVKLESRAVAPSLTLGVGTPTRVTLAAQIMRQDNLPDYGIPGAAWDEPLTPTSVLAPRPVDQSNYYGSIGYDYDKGRQNSYTARVEHDINRNLTLRNQTRYNQTERDAIISTIQNVAAYNAATNLVTIARQGNERENQVTSNQTNMTARFATGGLRHAANVGVEITNEEQFAPTLTGLGTRAPVDIFNPNPRDPIMGYAPSRTLGFSRGDTSTVAVYGFDSIELSDRWQVGGGLRWEHYDTQFESRDAAGLTTARLEGSDGLVSGKASVLFRINAAGNAYVSYGTSVTPPGNANFALSAQPNNQNNPNVDPQESTNVEVGSKWDFGNGRLSLNGAVFRTENKNVIFTVDATAVPPIYNQDDAQLVKGVSFGAMGRITDRWDVLANVGYLNSENQSQNPVNNGNRLTLTPEWATSIWTTYRFPIGLSVGGGVRHTDAVWINAANTIQSPGYHVVDALTEYAVNSHLTLRLNIYNLTSETYIRNVNNNGGRYNPGHPRSAMLTSNVKF
jgi:catecholate siderophore receptor